jgi:hypothetical protein
MLDLPIVFGMFTRGSSYLLMGKSAISMAIFNSYWLVVSTPPKNMKVSWEYYSHMEK